MIGFGKQIQINLISLVIKRIILEIENSNKERWNINLEEHGFNTNNVLGLYVLDDEAGKALEE